MLSVGPPLLHAITTFSRYIASMGTIPKCSFEGVYRTAYAFFSKNALSISEIFYLKTIESSMSNFFLDASSFNSKKCSTFSLNLSSYPPAIISLYFL